MPAHMVTPQELAASENSLDALKKKALEAIKKTGAQALSTA